MLTPLFREKGGFVSEEKTKKNRGDAGIFGTVMRLPPSEF
jgi:hypothetical protein